MLKKLQNEGVRVDENDFEHINRLEKYAFDVIFEKETNGLRPLRKTTNI